MRLLLHSLPGTQRKSRDLHRIQQHKRTAHTLAVFTTCSVCNTHKDQGGFYNPSKPTSPVLSPLLLSGEGRVEAQLTIGEGINWFSCHIQCCQTGTFGLSGSPALQSCFQGRRPITDHSQGLSLHWGHLAALGLGLVRVRLGN